MALFPNLINVIDGKIQYNAMTTIEAHVLVHDVAILYICV